MAWALFIAPYEHDRRPLKAVAFSVAPGLRNLPRDVVRAAVAAGKAFPATTPARQNKPTEQPAAKRPHL